MASSRDIPRDTPELVIDDSKDINIIRSLIDSNKDDQVYLAYCLSAIDAMIAQNRIIHYWIDKKN